MHAYAEALRKTFPSHPNSLLPTSPRFLSRPLRPFFIRLSVQRTSLLGHPGRSSFVPRDFSLALRILFSSEIFARTEKENFHLPHFPIASKCCPSLYDFLVRFIVFSYVERYVVVQIVFLYEQRLAAIQRLRDIDNSTRIDSDNDRKLRSYTISLFSTKPNKIKKIKITRGHFSTVAECSRDKI